MVAAPHVEAGGLLPQEGAHGGGEVGGAQQLHAAPAVLLGVRVRRTAPQPRPPQRHVHLHACKTLAKCEELYSRNQKVVAKDANPPENKISSVSLSG